MAKAVGERYDINVLTGKGYTPKTDTTTITLASPEVYEEMGLPTDMAEEITLYTAGHEGAHTRLSDINAFKKDFRKAINEGRDIDKLNNLLQITEDARVDLATIRVRPGYAVMRRKAVKHLNMLTEQMRPTGDIALDFVTALSDATYGLDIREERKHYEKEWQDAVDWTVLDTCTKAIMDLANTPTKTTSQDSVAVAVRMYDLLYPINPSAEECEDEENDTPKKSGAENTKDDSDSKNDSNNEKDTEDGDDPEEENTESNESSGKASSKEGKVTTTKAVSEQDIGDMLQHMLESVPSVVDKNTEDKVEKTKTKVKKAKTAERTLKTNTESRITRLQKVLSKEEDERFINDVCSDTHAGIGLAYYKPKIQHGTNRNKETYEKDKARYDNQAKTLGARLIADMKAAKDSDGYVSDNGKVIPSKTWKPNVTNDSRIFKKNTYEEVGDFVVDILLDSSGSQSSRQEQVAIQAFILAEALSIAGIPFQITAFSSHDSAFGTQMPQLVSYTDGRDKNINVFSYYASGDNRDGLAIKAVGWLIKRRPETNKIIIVLSDGQPACCCGYYNPAAKASPTTIENYNGKGIDPKTGLTAIEDVTRIIRKIRSEGIQLLGVYTGYGSANTLQAEKAMFGNDFAYIPDVKDFSTIVGNFLHKEILKAIQ